MHRVVNAETNEDPSFLVVEKSSEFDFEMFKKFFISFKKLCKSASSIPSSERTAN